MKFFTWGCTFNIGDFKILLEQQEQALHLMQAIQKEVNKMSIQLDALKQQMAKLVDEGARNTSVDQSAVLAIQGLADQQAILSQQLADAIAANDPAAIQEAADGIAAQVATMSASADALAAAIPVSTPSE